MDIGADEVKKYYDAHTEEFNRPEEVQLSDIFLSTENKTPEEIAAIQKQAGALRDRIIAGEDFADFRESAIPQGQTAHSNAATSACIRQLRRAWLRQNSRTPYLSLEEGSR